MRSTELALLPFTLLFTLASCSESNDGDRHTITVVFDGISRESSLADHESHDGRVPLDLIVEQTWPELSIDDIAMDFIAADGFRPGQRSNCQGLVPVSGQRLDRGFIGVETRNLTWDESFEYPGCLHPNDVETLVITEANTTGRLVRVIDGDQEVTVDLSLLPTEEIDGEAMVAVRTVVSASGASDAPNLRDFDLEGADGARPSVDLGLAPLPWSALVEIWIHPGTGRLHWSASLNLEANWSLDEVVAIHALERSVTPAEVTVALGDAREIIELGELELERVGTENLVPLQTVITASGLLEDSTPALFDFEGSDGYRVVEGFEDREPMSWTDIALGWLNPFSRNLYWADELDLSPPWFVNDLEVIHIVHHE